MRDERDYIGRTIATIRNHRHAKNSWPQWANVLADEIERLDEMIAAALRQLDHIDTSDEVLAGECGTDVLWVAGAKSVLTEKAVA